MHLKTQLHSLKMKPNDSMTNHIHEFRSLIQQLATVGNQLFDEDAVHALIPKIP